ncbi:MAG: esterase-like activity of phytase family protein [Methylocystaceae bacterium]|nr:esterase-like activity of phytase family protein [Methylocystaceae bacterium]
MKRWFFTLLFFLTLINAALADDIRVYAKAVKFAPFQTEDVMLTSITWLSSTDDRFGGFSALLKSKDGFISVTDKGQIARFNPTFQKVTLAPLREKNDDPLKGKSRSDAESLAQGPDGLVWVAFERDHRIVPYNPAGYVMGKKRHLPKDISVLSKNSGLEAIETLQDGRLVLLGEGKNKDDKIPMWVQGKKKGWKKYSLPKEDDFRATGLARLPDGDDLLLLERFYKPAQGVRSRITLLDAYTGKRGRRVAEISSPTPVDNFEGISAHKNEAGEIVITLISDDNFSILQRTLIMTLVMKKAPLN